MLGTSLAIDATPAADYDTPTALQTPAGSSPYNLQAVKRFVFNETGNIMVATTANNTDQIQDDVLKVFQEVSVFFAAMTKALSDTGNSLFDMGAVQRIISGSGMFVQVTKEKVSQAAGTFSLTFSKELIESLLGLASGAGELGFASAMLKSIGKQGLNVGGGYSKTSSKVGNIVFVCEYILGMPIVSAIVVYCDYKESKEWFHVGPCISGGTTSTALNMTKETYLFVTPASIKQFAAQLDSVPLDSEYQALISYLKGLLNSDLNPPLLGDIRLAGDSVSPAVTKLNTGQNYQLSGQNFGLPSGGALSFTGVAPSSTTLKILNWTDTNILFTATATVSTATTINLYKDSDAVTNNKISGTTTESYQVSAAALSM
jgi:hypothetical protein